MKIRKEIVDRIVCAKYIFQRGSEYLEKRSVYSDGLTVLHFQDAAEMILRAIAEHLHCSVKESITFNQLMEEIDKAGKGVLTHRTALNQLNKARVNFKHFGLEPKHEDVTKFHRDLEAFFPAAIRSFLDLDYDLLSLIDLVEHCRTRNYLKEAEKIIEADEFKASVQASAIAFQLFRRYAGHDGEDIRLSLLQPDVERNLSSFVRAIESSFSKQQDQINLIMDGINLGDYRRFARYIPRVQLSLANTIHLTWGMRHTSSDYTREIASFCLRFAMDSILHMQQYRVPPFNMIPFPNRYFRVLRTTAIIVWPCESPEVIRFAEAGETLQGHYENSDKPDFAAVVLDEDCAFVNRNDIQMEQDQA
jgi:hypothetical protein